MPLSWDDEEEDLTEIEYRRPKTTSTSMINPRTPQSIPQTDPRLSPSTLRSTKNITEGSAPAPRPTKAWKLLPATPRDRFTAFFIDSYVGLLFYLLVGWVLGTLLNAESIPSLHTNGMRMALHLVLTGVIFFFYYLLMESALGATLGKLTCGLRVLEVNGQSPSLGSIVIRNCLRLIDYPLAFLIAVLTIESSPLNQRLGDRAANTIVIKKARATLAKVDLKHTPLASTFSRLLAELIDLVLVGALLYGLMQWINFQSPYLSALLVLMLPLSFFAYYSLSEGLTGTSPGKFLFKRQVVSAHGQKADGSAVLLRALFRPLDYLLGYPLLVLSKQKQRLGDMAADTLIVAEGVGKKGLYGSLIALIVVSSILILGIKHPGGPSMALMMRPTLMFKSFLGEIPGFNKISIGGAGLTHLSPDKITRPQKISQKTKSAAPTPLPASTSQELKLVEFYFATGPQPTQIRHDRKFRRGDLVYLFFKIEGFARSSHDEVSLKQDLRVEDPKGKIIFEQADAHTIAKKIKQSEKSTLFANHFELSKDALKGKYRVVVTVFDDIAEEEFSFEKKFSVQ